MSNVELNEEDGWVYCKDKSTSEMIEGFDHWFNLLLDIGLLTNNKCTMLIRPIGGSMSFEGEDHFNDAVEQSIKFSIDSSVKN